MQHKDILHPHILFVEVYNPLLEGNIFGFICFAKLLKNLSNNDNSNHIISTAKL